MTSTTSIPPAYNRLIISHDYFVRLCRQQGRTLLYLLRSDRELDAPTGLDLGLNEGTDGVNGEEHHSGEDETEEVEAGVSQLSTDGLDTHIGNGKWLLEASEPVAATDLVPFGSRVDDGVL